MILGIGNDIVDIRRIARMIERHDVRFTERLFTSEERALCDSRAQRAASYAKRWAAKEACAKALGTGIANGVGWHDMGVVLGANGAPTLTLTGGAAARLAALAGPVGSPQIHLSLSDEPPYAQAFVVISAHSAPLA